MFLFEKTVEFYEALTGTHPDRKVLITPNITPEAMEWVEGTDIEVIPTDQLRL